MLKFVPANLAKDGYKTFHPDAYHPEVTEVYSNLINRSGKHTNIPPESDIGGVVVAGAQRFVLEFLLNYFNDTFFYKSIEEVVRTEKRVLESYLGKEVSTERIEALHKLGYLPLEVKSLPEGMIAPYGVAVITVRSTIPEFAWLTNSIETVMSCEVCGVSTSATTSAAYYKTFLEFARKTGASEEFIPFQGHDFSMRGMIFGREGAYLSGLGHLMGGFMGTDTIGAGMLAETFYAANISNGDVIASVDATEHSVTCSWMEEGEEEFVEYLMSTASPEGILSIVSDTWDFWGFVTEILPRLKDKIMARNGKVVIRPDSGDPADILCGTAEPVSDENFTQERCYESKKSSIINIETGQAMKYDHTGTHGRDIEFIVYEASPQEKGLIEVLWDIFGGTVNEAGFKQLDPHIGAIYGDSITLQRQRDILQRLMDKGFASDNVVLGIGSYTYQYVTRDTHGSAVKATSVIKGGERKAIYKDPITDRSKKSARGLLCVDFDEDGNIVMEMDVSETREREGLLRTIFLNGKFIMEDHETLNGIRERVKLELEKQLTESTDGQVNG